MSTGLIVGRCALHAVGVVQSARCDGQSQLLQPNQHDPKPQQHGQCVAAAAGVYARLGGLASSSSGLGAAACPQQQYQGASSAATSVLSAAAAFRASAVAAAAATPAAVSVGESAFYFQDGAEYRTTPVAGAPMTSYYEKCAI